MTSRKPGRPNRKRQNLLQALESRQMLAGPQLIGIQPNEGDLIENGTVLNIAPRALTFRFDEVQQIAATTLDGIRITRSGPDQVFGTTDDVRITPGLVTLGDIRQNEVVIRFNENLPDDKYRLELFAFDDAINGVRALRNVQGEAFAPNVPGSRSQTVQFSLNLGALIEAIVPQPVVRNSSGVLEQRRNEIVVYFNEDQLFVENGANGLPTARSAENPRFYQLLLTQETVRTTDDLIFKPTRVIYDASTNTARLIFADDINKLPGVSQFGGTFRLRVGSAVDNSADFVFAPTRLSVAEAGDTAATSFDVGSFSTSTSLIVSGQIQPQSFRIQLPGSPDDPGRLLIPEGVGGGLAQVVNERFGPDSRAGITEIAYNFQSVFSGGIGGQPAQLNNITNVQKVRIREALTLWSRYLGVQFRETASAGITFAVGNINRLDTVANLQSQTFPQLNARVRIDPNFNIDPGAGPVNRSAIVFSSQTSFGTAYAQDFFRKAMAGIGFLLGLEQSSDQTAQTLMTLDTAFLNEAANPTTFIAPVDSFFPLLTSRQQTINDAIDSQLIDDPVPNALTGSEPTFPGNIDVLHGQFLYRPDGNDVDLYRFAVGLGSESATGTLNVETFAERLADSSSLDTTLSLFRDQSASAFTDLGVGNALSVKVNAVQSGSAGNNARIDFVQSTRVAGDTAIRISRVAGANGGFVSNGIVVDIPRATNLVPSVPASAVVNAINTDAFARTLFRASIEGGSATTNIARATGNFLPIVLSGGGIVQLSRNDDYFSEDSLLTAELGNGVYYIGVASTGNDNYNPGLANSGFGGTTQGRYDVQIRFLPQVSDFDSIRDRDTVRVGVPGTALDGDGDGTPGGVKNFWFQTRPLERTIEITGNGASITAGQTLTIVGANGTERRFEFVNLAAGGIPAPGNIAIDFTPLTSLRSGLIADRIRTAIRNVRFETGVTADVTGSVLTLNGERSLSLSANFSGAQVHGRTIFVDKTASVVADGTKERPFNSINNPAVPNAFGVTFPTDIVRIVGNGGIDRKLESPTDNFSYQIGVPETGNTPLIDGRNLDVPKGVTVMIDAGASFKLRSSTIQVGSSNLLVDRSGAALQILGTPRLVTLTDPTSTSTGVSLVLNAQGLPASGKVTFTSTRDRAVDAAASSNSPAAAPGNWGGIIYRRDVDRAQGRTDAEDQGIFLNSVNHADIRFGGGSNLLIDGIQQTVNPIQLVELRPAVTFNLLSNNANAAISASPDTFEETSFQAPRFQQAGAFTPDYGRTGPEISNNLLTNNSINGLFVRTETVPGQVPKQLTVAGRFDDINIVHYIAENIVIAGTPGGSLQDAVRPDFSSVATTARPGGLLTVGAYSYRLTFVDPNGFESLASLPSTPRTVATGESIELLNLPSIPAGSDYLSRRLYRLRPGQTTFELARELPASGGTFIDNGSFSGAPLNLARTGIRGRLDASLVIDPGTVVKIRGSRIELGQGTQLLAEGTASRPVIFTSFRDDRYGGGGSFDTNNDRSTPNGGSLPLRGDWSGIYASPNSNISLDFTTVSYGGGVSLIEGGQSRGFLALELQQASGRVTNSRFEFNDYGQDGSGPIGRNGRLAVTPATIFVRASQPTIVNNQFLNNFGSIIDIDLGSMTDRLVLDPGRQIGAIDRFNEFDDNRGPLIRLNTTSSTAGTVEGQRQLNGLRIRGGQLTGGSVWDDTDIAHVLFDSVVVGNQISGGVLTLKSRPDESLVIKLLGNGTPNSPTLGTGITATGSKSDISDRIGGTVHVLGLAGAPVVFTSYNDDSVAVGRRFDGTAQGDTNGDAFGSRPSPNDWRSIYFDGLSNDRNLASFQETELSTELAPGLNGTIRNPQILGELAERLTASDDLFRLGFDVRGSLSEPNDIDTYSFSGVSGTQIWIDIDNTSFGLDTVVELVDPNGVILARSDNSFDEFSNPSAIFRTASTNVAPLGLAGPYAETWASGFYADFGSTNPRDAGFSVALPGEPGIRNNYFVRVRSVATNPTDTLGGTTKGVYSLQVRLREDQEFPGSVIQFGDVRFANIGIHLQSLPGSSPLLGESQENESTDVSQNNFGFARSGGDSFGTVLYATNIYANNDLLNGGVAFPIPVTGIQTRPLGARPQYIGNLVDSKTGTLSVGGALSAGSDIDFYQVDVTYDTTLDGLQRSTVFDIDYADGFDRPDTNLSIYYSPTGSPSDARLVLFGSDSNLVDDQASPLTTEDIGELLSRGSAATGDAFIGPISLPQGSYFVAVTERGRAPQEFVSNPTLRREPLDSITRIFEDHVDSIGGGTADAPVEGAFVATAGPGWIVTNNRATDAGHQITSTFNGGRVATSFPPSNQFEFELNDSFETFNDLDTTPFSLAFESNVGSTTANTSLTVPHTSVLFANTSGDIVDVYRFTVPQDGSAVVLDIDNGFNPQSLFDFTSVDLKLQLFRETISPLTGLPVRTLVTTNSFAPTASGSQGSLGGLIAGVGGLTTFSNDPYIETVLLAGTYYVAVSPELTVYDPVLGTFDLDVALRPLFGTYDLNVSIANKPFAGGDPGNQSYRFDRTTAIGDLQSAAFDLSGYSAAELPRFYFDFLYNPAFGDAVTLTATSAQRTTPIDLGFSFQTPLVGQIWRQGIADLSRFAGNTDIVLQFRYTTDPVDLVGEGLYLDNFVVGFAERGEIISGARSGDGTFNTGFGGVPGQYQLEVRAGSNYTNQVQGGIELENTFDTNDRLTQQITLIAPAGALITSGDRFILSDGNRDLTFEFSTTGTVASGNIIVPYLATDSAPMVSRRIIDVINSGTVQNLLRLKAATASGLSDFTNNASLPTDAKIALQGSARGNFIPVTSVPAAGTPLLRGSDGLLTLPAIYHDGIGDVNQVRTQGAVNIDSNRVSDARAIGIYSDVGFRETDPEDNRSPEVFVNGKNHLRQPPVGNSQLGAALNLPTLNDSAKGGIAPGVTITNNIVDQAGFTGIKVDGETRPFVIEWDGNTANYVSAGATLQSRADILVPDGFIFAIDAGGTRVVFEFEDVQGATVPLGGSGVVGGDGFVDGHVPIYYRLGGAGATYNPTAPSPIRNHGFSAHEMIYAIYEAIQGSILVTNGLVELVRPTIGPSITAPFGPVLKTIGADPIVPLFGSFSGTLDFTNPALYLEGVSGIYTSIAFQKALQLPRLNIFGSAFGSFFDFVTGQTSAPPAPLAPVYESPQPLAKIINNTVYGADGTESSYLSDGSISRAIEFPSFGNDAGDSISTAIDTKQGRSHRGAYLTNTVLGDNVSVLSADQDVDFYQVELSVGDRLVVDIDTVDGGPSTALRLFNSRGIAQTAGQAGEVPAHVKPGTSVEFPTAAVTNQRDRFIDFTAIETGTYYIGVSSRGNDSYDALSLTDRLTGTGGTGAYRIGIEVFAPRSFVISLDTNRVTPFGAEETTGTDNGTDTFNGVNSASIIGTTFTISQIPDYLIPTRTGDAYRTVVAVGNRVTFQFTAGENRIVLANGNINVPVLQGANSDALTTQRVPDIMRSIANAINGYLNNPALPNHELGNGPQGASGPVSRVKARALGGSQTDNAGIENLSRIEGIPFPAFPGGGFDFTDGFGHDRRENGNLNLVPDGTFTDSRGSTEIYALIENAAKIELSPAARAAGFKLGPDNSRLANGAPRNPQFATGSDQVLTEFGILVSSGASAAILNNVVINAHQSIVKDETSVFGFGGRIDELNPDRTVKPAQVVLTGNAVQFDDERNSQIRSDLSWWVGLGVNVINRNPVLDSSLSTDLRTGPSNIPGGNSDFNFVVRPAGTLGQSPGNFINFVGSGLVEDAAANRFTPLSNTPIVDSAIDSILENTALANLKRNVGIPAGLIIAPKRDNSGQLRADDPLSAPPGGLGSNVFKDRGASERADFVGPSAFLEVPRDNDAFGVDTDPAVSFLQLNSGVYNEFRILLQDVGDSADPFVGTGIDDDTVVVPVILGLRASGAVVALFEGDRLLVEGIDYTFSYDTTKNVISLRPLAGIWRDDRAYRIKLNNRDRIVAVAPAAGQILDGDSFVATDNQGGRVTFEYDSGYQLRVPETLQLTVPPSGTDGVADGDLFSLTAASGQSVVFQFKVSGSALAGTQLIRFQTTDSPTTIAASIRTAIATAISASLIDVDVDVTATGPTVVIGSDAAMILDLSTSSLVNAARTLALRVPSGGAGLAGVNDGDVLTINDGNNTISFEFEIAGGLNNPTNTPIPIPGLSQTGVRDAIRTAILGSTLRITPIAVGNNLFLGLPTGGFATVSQGQLTPVGISRTPTDGDTIRLASPTGQLVTLELTRDTAITPGNVPVNFSRQQTGDTLAAAIANALQSITIEGLNSAAVQANLGGLVSIGGTAGLGLTLTTPVLNGTPTIVASGRPDVTGPTLLSIFGPLLVQLPIVGGTGIEDDSQFSLSDGTNTRTFIYNLGLTGIGNLAATPITYQTFQDPDTIGAATVAAINASGLTIIATYSGNGIISLGTIADAQLTFPPLSARPFTSRRGIVNDGERITITQAGQRRVFEFESAIRGGGVSPGSISVVFQPNGTVDDVATVLAAAINNNNIGLSLTAQARPGGLVQLADTPQTTTDVSLAPTVTRSGTAGGAIAIPFTGSFSATDIKRAIIDAIAAARSRGLTTLDSTERGGSTFFIENAVFVEGQLSNYSLEGIKDLAGQLLEPTRTDNTTQFTILLPSSGLDYGDAPDPVGGLRGRYPTLLDVDGARHVVNDQVRLGALVDIDTNGLPNTAANGDDTTIFIRGVSGGNFFSPTLGNGFVEVAFNLTVPFSGSDGNTITLSTGVDTATLELDTDGIFNENNFPVSVNSTGALTLAIVAQAFANAVRQSPLRPAAVQVTGNTVRVITDDEDGVIFASDSNPAGVLNRGVPTPISVTVTGGGVVEAWIDFNFDGDFTDPGEQIIDRTTPGAIFSANATNTPVTRQFVVNIPSTSPAPASVASTYARFRVSAEGGLSPTGLALSGEVEDYRLSILPGLPPAVNDTNRTRNYTVDEDAVLQAIDADGTLTPSSANDDGVVAKIIDPDGDIVAVFVDDVGTRTLLDPSGANAGELTLLDDGTFSFVPSINFFGNTKFTFRVTDVPQSDPLRQLVSPIPVTVNLTIRPVNDRPFVTGSAPRITRSIAEDSVVTFTMAELTGFYSPGPINESTQPLQVQSAGVGGFGFQTAQGGVLAIVNGNLQYTPPVNFFGTDTFTYVVADDPNDVNQLVQSAVTQGTISVTITPVNDAPFTGTDSFTAAEDTPLTISIGGANGILANDRPGPADEVAAGQTVSLVTTGPDSFPKTTDRGGRIEFGPGNTTLIYTPPSNFDGRDQFTYRVSDNGSPSATALGTVVINVGGDNDAPVFIGVNGIQGQTSLTLNESKETEQVLDFNLSSWFSDPEGDATTYVVTSSNTSIVSSEVILDGATQVSTLRLRLRPFKFGDLQLNIVATNPTTGPNGTTGPSTSQVVLVTVNNTPDPPIIIGALDPLNAFEDEVIVRDLATVFADSDGGQLTYKVTRFGALQNPTAAQIAASPLVNTITFNGNAMTITLDQDATGSVDIQIAATDGTFQIADTFTLVVAPVADAPRGTADFYNVPIGARFEIIDPSRGLIGNDIDPDAEVFAGTTRRVRVDLTSVTQPANGTVVVNEDGTFVYTNNRGTTGGTDTFTYVPVDPTGRSGNVVTVTFNLGRSRYQNPIPGFSFDVTANGVVSPLDALRVINLLARQRKNSVPVSSLTTAPPDFVDVNGDGVVTTLDALQVINEIARRNRRNLGGGEGESQNQNQNQIQIQKLSTTVAYAAPTTVGLKESNLVAPLMEQAAKIEESKPDDVFAAGFEVVDRRVETSAEDLHQLTQPSKSTENTKMAVDEVLSSWFDQSIL